MHLMRINPQAQNVPGKQMEVADTLSSSPLKLEQEPDAVKDVQAFVDLAESARPATDSQLERIRVTSTKEAQLQKVIDFTSQGWQTRVEEVPLQIREFFYSLEHLSISNGLLTYDDRIVYTC